MKIILKLIFKIFILLNLIISTLPLHSQADVGAINDYHILSNNDTLLVTRIYGDNWFGVSGGVEYNFFWGQVETVPPSIKFEQSLENTPFLYDNIVNNNKFLSQFFGIQYEWFGPLKDWGLTGRLNFYNARFFVSKYDETLQIGQKDEEKDYTLENNFTFWQLSLGGKYKLPWIGETFRALGGIDISFLNKDEIFEVNNFQSGSQISQKWVTNELPNINPFRLGMYLGLEFEYIVTDINEGLRVKFAPFITAHFDPMSVSNENNTSLGFVSVRAGLGFKLGPDNKSYDTLRYDPNANLQEYLTEIDRSEVIRFDGFLEETELVVSELTVLELPEVFDQMKEEPEFADNKPQDKSSLSEVEKKPKKKIEFNKDEKFSYKSSKNTSVTKELRQRLNDYIIELKKDPKAEIRIVAHTDNTGTPIDQQTRSDARARKARLYLQSKGIAKRRILASGVGARKPLTSNRTDSGRRKNRRVEIKIIKK